MGIQCREDFQIGGEEIRKVSWEKVRRHDCGTYRGPFTSCPMQAKAFCGPFNPTLKLSSNSVMKVFFLLLLLWWLSAINKIDTHTHRESFSTDSKVQKNNKRESGPPRELIDLSVRTTMGHTTEAAAPVAGRFQKLEQRRDPWDEAVKKELK